MQATISSYKKQVLILIAAIGILRLIVAFNIDLGNDESYYWLYSQHLKLNYFDHPPMIAYWIRICTLNLKLQDYPGFIRLSSVISCCVATWFMYKCVATLRTERAGFIAACLYNASFYAGITAGIYAMPDSPQMIFLTAGLYLVVLITQNENNWKYWLLFGVVSGLCIMSKIHGIFLWIGIGGYTLFYKRRWFSNARLYAALIIAVVICLPILSWNIKYNFATFKFNGPRIDIADTKHNWIYFRNEILAQIFYTNPVNFVCIVLGLIALIKQKIARFPALTIFNFTGIPLACILIIISLYKPTLAHWSGPGYVSLLPLAAVYIDERIQRKPVKFAGLSLGLHVIVLLVCAYIVNYSPINFGVPSGRYLGMTDPSLDMFEWKEAGEKFDSVYSSYLNSGKITKQTPIVCEEWGGSHVEYYFCRPLNIKMIGLGNIMDLHEYMWLNNERKNSVDMSQAFCVVPSDEFYYYKKYYTDYYNYSDSVTTIHTYRSGTPAHNFYIYHLSGWKGTIPVINY